MASDIPVQGAFVHGADADEERLRLHVVLAQVYPNSSEHGVVDDPGAVLKPNDKLRLVPGHCDPTCNVHDWYVGVRGGKVEVVWPVSARGRAY